jgi:hypothetical protein
MKEQDVRSIPQLRDLPVFDEEDPRAQQITSGTASFDITAAEDTVRLHDLLHREEYRALGAVRFHREQNDTVCVYFVLHDHTE